MHISWGKLLTFGLVTLVVGLLQVWILWLVLAVVLKKPTELSELLGDGGLFFFATSITVSSFLVLTSRYRLKTGTVDLNVTLILAGAAALCAVVVYSSVMIVSIGTVNPFKDHLLPQLACALAAFTYAFYVAIRTGQLKP